MSSKGVSTLILILGFTALVSMACENQTDRQTIGEATPSPAVGMSPSPVMGGAASASPSPYTSPNMAASPSPVAALTAPDREFMSNAARGGMLEVQLGNMAAQRGSSDEVKRFGERLAADHTQLGQRLQQLSSNTNTPLPQDLSPDQQATITRLQKLSGKAFDHEFLRTMVSDHTRNIAAFERISAQSPNPEIKQFATEALPTLHDHMKIARELAAGKSSAN